MGIVAAVAIGAIVAIVVIARDENHLQVQTADVTSGPIARRVLVSGTLEPARMVEVGSQVSGTIASLPVDFSSRVKAGQVIARLDPALFETRLAEAEAGLARAQAERASRLAALDDARMKLEDAQALAGDQQLARAELDLARTAMLQASADVKGAEAGIAAARAMVTEARVSLDRTIIRSPIDGVVIGRHVDVGQTIAASVQAPILFTIGDLRRMRLLAEVPEGEVGGVQRGSQVSFDIESIGGRAFTGTVAEVRLVAAGRAGDRHQRGRGCDPGAGRNLELDSCCDQRDHATGGLTGLRHHGTARRSGHVIFDPRDSDDIHSADSCHDGCRDVYRGNRRGRGKPGHPAWQYGNRDTGWFRADAGRANPEQFPHVRPVGRLVRRRGSGAAGSQPAGQRLEKAAQHAEGSRLEV